MQALSMPDKPTSPPANKLLGLELLRFVAAFGVLIWHYQHFAYVADKPVDLIGERLPLSGLLYPFYHAGAYGVWVFWCISGFIFFWKYRDAIADRSIDGRSFFVLRLSRLYPLHIVTLLLVAGLQAAYFDLNGYFFVWQNNDLKHFLLQIFMASNWGFQDGQSFDGPVWSISVEVLVYAAFFLMLRFATRAALLNVVVIFACLYVSGQVFACLAFFYAGGLAAIARRSMASATFKIGVERTAWLAVVAIPLSVWILKSQQFALNVDMLLLAYTPLFLFCLSRDIAMTPWIRKVVEAAGNMTYSSYLLHFPIQLMLALGFGLSGAPIPYYDTTFFVVFVATTLLASYLTYYWFETPAQNFIRNRLLRAGTSNRKIAFSITDRALSRAAD
jgi:peptidoglycan/LPS O-acetylase OafA/YrhL